MKIFNKILILLCLQILFNIQASDSKINLLQDQPVVNLVICNDCSEAVIDKDSAIVYGLLDALLENQLVLTTKKLYNNLAVAHAAFQAKEDTFFRTYTLMQTITRKYASNINELHKQMQKMVGNFVGQHLKLTLFAAYDIFLAHNYICKEVDEDHILFIPAYFFSDETRNATRSRFKEIGVSKIPTRLSVSVEDCTLGLSISKLKDFDYKNPVFCEPDEDCVPCGNTSIVDAMQRLSLKPKLASKISLDLLAIVLPKMNVYLNGHGTYKGLDSDETLDDTIAGISCTKKGNEQSDFEKLLMLFNSKYNMQTLSILTCFAGLNFKRLIDNIKQQSFFEVLSYPILFASGLFASGTTYALADWIKFNILKEELQHYLYNINGTYFYGPKKLPNGQGMYESFFKHLNHVEKYTLKSSQTLQDYSYVAYRPEYNKAVDVLLKLFEAQGVSELSNLTFAHFPGTAWISNLELDKRIKTITPIQALTSKQGITIPADAQLVLLSTPYVQYPIKINQKTDSSSKLWIVPTMIADKIDNFTSYCIEEIDCACDINSLGRMFFNQELLLNLHQSFSVLIKKARCGAKQYSDILLFYQYTPGEFYAQDAEEEYLASQDRTLGDEESSVIDDMLYEPEQRFAIMVYKDEKEQKIKKFVYKGHDIETMQDFVDSSYKEGMEATESLAHHMITDLQTKIHNLEQAFESIVKYSAKDVAAKQEERSQKAKKENLAASLLPNYGKK